jgi:predicted RNase H-like HicB family nuclease
MYVLTEYLDQAMAQAVYDKLDDGTYGGRIPPCPGVIAFAASLAECAEDLRSTLEDWVLLGMKLAHALPVIGGIDLNREPVHEPVDTLSAVRLHPPAAGPRFQRASGRDQALFHDL